MIEDILADSQEKVELSTSQPPVPSNKNSNEDVITDSSEEYGSVEQMPEATEYLGRKKAIGDTFMELGQLFYKQDTDHQYEVIKGRNKTIKHINELRLEITRCYSDLIARQNELANKNNVEQAETKKFHSDLIKQSQDQHAELLNQFRRQEEHALQNHILTMKARDTQEREEKRRFEDSIHQRDRLHTESMAKLEHLRVDAHQQYKEITRRQAEILGEIKAVQRSLIDLKKPRGN